MRLLLCLLVVASIINPYSPLIQSAWAHATLDGKLNAWMPSDPALAPIGPENAGQLAPVSEMNFGPWDLATAVAWSPDGAWLAAAAGDRVYLLAADPLAQGAPGQATTSIPTPVGYKIGALTQQLAFSPDGIWLAAGSHDGLVRIWRSVDLSQDPAVLPALTIEAHRKGVNSVAFSPDGTRLASGGNDAVARFWEPGTGENLGLMIGGTFVVPSMVFLPDGQTLAVINGGRIRLRDVGSERIIGTLASEAGLFSIAVSPDGGLLAAGGSDNRIRLWDPATAFKTGSEHYPEPRLLEGHNGRIGTFRTLIWQVVFSPDGRTLASAGGDGTVRLWEVNTGGLLATLQAHPGGATGIAFHPQGHLLATTGLDGRLVIYSLAS